MAAFFALRRPVAGGYPKSQFAGRLGHMRSVSSISGSTEEEIERKFRANADVLSNVWNVARRCESAPPLTSQLLDIYFDTACFDLSTRDMWLRRRNKGFELKWPLHQSSPVGPAEGASSLRGVDFYNESTSWSQIAEQLRRLGQLDLIGQLPADNGSGDACQAWLRSNGLSQFASIHTTRRRYKLLLPVGGKAAPTVAGGAESCHSVNVDLDDVRYDLSVGVETSVSADSAANSYSLGGVELVRAGGGMSAREALTDVFATLGIGHEPVRGKVLEWLVRFRPSHYAALERCGLIAAKMQ